MESILRVIQYLFNKNDIIDMEDKNIDYFFSNGVNFPQLVMIAFNIQSIPNVNLNSHSNYQIKLNNEASFDYLKQNNEEIKKILPNYSSERDQEFLLSLILTKQIYKIDFNLTLMIINQIFEPLGITFNNKIDIINNNFLIQLIKAITGCEESEEDELKNFNERHKEIFTKAKVPLVIDESCLDTQNQYLFLIQIEIIFDTLIDKIIQLIGNTSEQMNENSAQMKQLDEDHHQIILNQLKIIKKRNKNKRVNKIEYNEKLITQEERISDQMILDIVNEIGKNCGLHFENFYEAIQNGNNLASFVHYLLKNNESAKGFLNHLIMDKSTLNSMKIKNIINFLKSIEPKFDILSFDFKNPDYIESSSIQLYTNLLDFFFLKKSKDELYDRCYTLLYGRYKKGNFMYKPYHDKIEILRDWNTYNTLISFINNKECKFKFDLADYFDQVLNDHSSSKVPFIITEKYLNAFPSNVIPPAVYYQLQFIFNALDSSDFSHHLVEYFLITMRKFSQIEVPPTDTIVMSIRTKNLSLIQQNKRYEQIFPQISKKKFQNQDNKDDSDDDYLSPLRVFFKRKHRMLAENETDFSEILLNTGELPTYNKEIYYDDGILFENKLDSTENINWIELMSYAQIDRKKVKQSSSDFEPLFLKTTGSDPSICKFEIYKLYYYDEKLGKWDIHDQNQYWHHTFGIFYPSKRLNPFVLFLETSTTKTLTLLKTINGRQNENIDLDQDDICIYIVCNKNLYDLKFDETKYKFVYDSIPYFLFLNVPDSKKKLPNIQTIIFQIYAFLSIISDINIVILDKTKYKEQINFITKIDRLRHSYEIKDPNEINLYKYRSEQYKLSKSKEKDDDYFDMDEEEDYQDDEVNENDIKKDLLCHINPTLLQREMKLFVLINDDEIQYHKTNPKIKHSRLFEDFVSNKINSEYYFINLNNAKTYGDFISDLIKTVGSINDISDNYERLKLIEYFHMNNNYVYLLNNEKNWKEMLVTIIHTKFSKLINDDNEFNSNFDHLLTLQKEIFSSFPLLDNEYFDECNSIIADLKKQLTNNQIFRIIGVLKESSINHIQYIKQLIKSKPYLPNKQLNDIKDNHHNFLKEEYFELIKKSYPSKLHAIIYTDNISILEDQITKDNQIIEKLIKEKREKQKQNPRETNAIKGTNYTIRERENEREVKVRIEGNKTLKDLIDQDF